MHRLDDYLKYYKLKQNDTVLDLGACDGEFEAVYLKDILATNTTCYVVEPGEVAHKHIVYNRKEKNFIHLNVMVAGTTGEAEYVITDQNALNYKKSLDHDIKLFGAEHKEIKTVVVKTITLDDLIATAGHFDFVKCDIEGSELEVFMNSKFLDKVYNCAIAVYHMVDGEETYKTLEPFMKAAGYYTILDENIPPWNLHSKEWLLYCSRNPL